MTGLASARARPPMTPGAAYRLRREVRLELERRQRAERRELLDVAERIRLLVLSTGGLHAGDSAGHR